MKKIYNFLRSMKFGMILLVLILLCSLIGSLLLQNMEPAYYEEYFPSLAGIILALQFDNIFVSWYFIALAVLLLVNLTLCSIIRLKNNLKGFERLSAAADAAPSEPMSHSQRDKLSELLKKQRFKKAPGAQSVYYKNRLGHFGSFTVHLSLLLMLVFAAASAYFVDVVDATVHIGDTYELTDGAKLTVESFRTTDEEGNLDYVSVIDVTDKNGAESGPQEISVNYPYTFGGHKYYQQSYGFTGAINVTYGGQSSLVYCADEQLTLSVDENNSLTYLGLYPDYRIDENGQAEVMLDANSLDDFVNPIYKVGVVRDGEAQEGVVLPGETLEVGGVYYTFESPSYYPVIRIKTSQPVLLGCLYGSFALMVLGLWLCFFHVPVYVKLDSTGYALKSTKPVRELSDRIDSIIKKEKGGDHA